MQFTYQGSGSPITNNVVSLEPLALYEDVAGGIVWIALDTATPTTWVTLATYTGTLPVSIGGTGTSTPSLVGGGNISVTGTWPNQTITATGLGSGSVTSVDVSGGTTGLTTSGGPVTTAGTITLGGTLAVANGGTNSTTALSGGSIMVSNGTSVVQGAKGTTTTVLHGNASGAPTYSAVSLTTDVSGTLPIANGGTGTTTPSLVGGSNISVSGSWPNQTIAATGLGSGTVTSVAASGGTTGLTFSGSPVTTSGTLTLGGTLAVASGGTGTATPSLVAGTNISITGTWPNQTVTAAGAGLGTVTSFSSGNLSPLFTTSVATATTTPALSYSLSTAAANTFFGNFTGSTAAPSFGSPTLASANFANQGTTTTVLHGNASGNPSWSAVSLTADVSGTLPVANGGTGTTTPSLVAGTNVTITGTWPNQTINSSGGGGGGTVTNSTTLTSNALVLGNGGADTKVAAGLSTDGTSKINLGVAGASVGAVALANATSGTITLQPPTGALGTVTVTVPASTDTLANLAGSQAFTNKTYNGLTVTSSTGTLTVTNAKTASFSNSITFAGTDSTTMTFPPASASIGYINIPQNSQSAAYTTVAADAGKHIFHPAADTTARTFTIDSNANVPYAIGTTITFINETSQLVTIAITSDTLTLAGTTTTGSRTLSQNGMATATKITSTKWIISGSGLS